MNRPPSAGASTYAAPSHAFSLKRILFGVLLIGVLAFVWYEYPAKQGPSCMPNCEGLDMSGQELAGMTMRSGNFTNANFHGANLEAASFFLSQLTREPA